MPKTGCLRSGIRSDSRKVGHLTDDTVICTCGWELRLGYGIAVSLATFEAKRLCLLVLEIIVEWQIIKFAGGYRPVVLTVIDIFLGFPCALAAAYSIRKKQLGTLGPKPQKVFTYLFVTITVCAILNTVTIASIGYYVSVKQRRIATIFNSSMYLYMKKASCKYSIDQIQLGLQCCGHTSYSDWFLFDWQMVDYAPRDEMSVHEIISDELYRDRGVPFSCCNLRILGACAHTQMVEEDTRTINVTGCSGILSNYLIRIVLVAYAITTVLVVTQALLAVFLARIDKRSRTRSDKYSTYRFSKESLVQSFIE